MKDFAGYEYHDNKFISTKLPYIFHRDFRLPGDRFFIPNWHRSIELLLCTKGSGTVKIANESIPFELNDIIIFNSNEIHMISTDCELKYSCFILDADFCEYIGISTDQCNFVHKITDDNMLFTMLTQIEELYFQNNELRRTRAIVYIGSLLLHLYENHISSTKLSKEINSKRSGVLSVLNYIHTNSAEKITLDVLAKQVNMNKFQLCKDFKLFTGYSIVEYINIKRCHNAHRFIESGKTVSEAAFDSGFGNLSYFTRTFKKLYGYPPSELKKNST